jgi:hypothetical protein
MPLKDPDARRRYHTYYMRIWYPKNKQRHLSYLRNLKKKLLKYVEDFKKTSVCSDCGISGEKYPRILDFHHTRGRKKFEIAGHAKHTLSLKKIKMEIKKCDIVCANCHRIRTIYKRANR